MIPRVLKAHIKQARKYIKEKGLITFIRNSPIYFFRFIYFHQKLYIWEKDVRDFNVSPIRSVANHDFKVISKLEELDDLLKEDFTFDSCFNIDEARRMLAERWIGFLIFVQKELAWWGWAVTDEGAHIYPPLKKIDYTVMSYIGSDITLPRYRGQGLYTYGNIMRYKYLKQKGKSKVIFTCLTENEPVMKAQEKFGSVICGKLNNYRFFIWEFWREKWDKDL